MATSLIFFFIQLGLLSSRLRRDNLFCFVYFPLQTSRKSSFPNKSLFFFSYPIVFKWLGIFLAKTCKEKSWRWCIAKKAPAPEATIRFLTVLIPDLKMAHSCEHPSCDVLICNGLPSAYQRVSSYILFYGWNVHAIRSTAWMRQGGKVNHSFKRQ